MNKDNTIEPDKLKVELRVVLKQQWSSAYRAGHNGKMLAQLITEPIIEDAVINKIFALFNKYSKAREIEARIDELENIHRYDGKDYDTQFDEMIDDRIDYLEIELGTLKDNYGE